MAGDDHSITHAFCETSAAITTHIRALDDDGRKEGGMFGKKTLCGAPAAWDTRTQFTAARVAKWNPWPYQLCARCKAAFERPEETPIP